MKNSTHIFQRLISYIVWGIIILIALFLVLIVVSPRIPEHWPSESTAELEQIRTELPLAEARWKSYNITDYKIDVDSAPTCFDLTKDPTGPSSPWHLKIKQGEIVFDSDAQKRNIEQCGIGNFLPPKVFDTVRQILKEANPKVEYVKIEFDPVYGFVSDYFLTSNSRLSDLYVHYAISNFHPQKP